MTPLAREKCEACRSDAPHVTEDEIAEFSPQVPDWGIAVDDGIRKLQRVFRFGNFRQAQGFANAIGNLAETAGHHPRLVIEWGCATVTWWTDKMRDLHRNDFIMAAKTDQVYREHAKAD